MEEKLLKDTEDGEEADHGEKVGGEEADRGEKSGEG